MTVLPAARFTEHATIADALMRSKGDVQVGFYPIVTSQYRSTTLCQVSYHIQSLFF